MRVFVVGAGMVGGLLARRLRQAGHDVTAGARSPARARAFLGAGIPVRGVDAGDAAALARCARGADVLVQATVAVHNRSVLRAAISLGAHYLDLSSQMSRSPFHPEQLEYAGRFLAKGRAAIFAAGLSPGLTNLLARASADELDEIESVRVRLFEETDGDSPLSSWSAVDAFDEAVSRPVVLRDGELCLGRRFGEPERFTFPAPIGTRVTVLAAQDEVVTLPRVLAVEHADAKIGGRDIEQLVRAYRGRRLRRASRPPPRRFPPTPTPSELAALVQRGAVRDACFAAAVVVAGSRRDAARVIRHDVRVPSLRELLDRGVRATPIAFATANVAACFVRWLPRTRPGVWPPEALPRATRRAVLACAERSGIVVERRAGPPPEEA